MFLSRLRVSSKCRHGMHAASLYVVLLSGAGLLALCIDLVKEPVVTASRVTDVAVLLYA